MQPAASHNVGKAHRMPDVWVRSPGLRSGLPRATRLAAVLVCLATGLAACTPSPTYQDPLAQIGGTVPPAGPRAGQADFREVSLGVVLTANTIKAMRAATEVHQHTAGLRFDSEMAVEDADPVPLTRAIQQALKHRFKRVVKLDNFAAAKAVGVDAVMFLDIRIGYGSITGTDTTVKLRGIIVDPNHAQLGEVAGNGTGTLPIFPTAYMFHEAAERAVKQFAQSLDHASDIAARLRAPVLPASAPSAPELASAPAAPFRPLPASARRVALVVGNARYRNVPTLSNTANDARLVARTLKSLGFTLVGGGAQLDLDRHQFLTEIAQFGRMLNAGSVAVFYYAGHGLQLRGENYLVPVDANPEKPSDADIQLVDTGAILHQMEDSGARLKVVMLDACRNNPFGGRGLRGVDSGLAQMAAPVGTLISYATAPGHVAEDGAAGGDGPYALALTRAMRQPGVGILRMFNDVAVRVDATTAHAQQPWLALSPIDGDFYFDGR